MTSTSATRLGAVAAAAVAAPVLIGIGYVASRALRAADGAFSTARLFRVLQEPAVWESLTWSLLTAGAATTIALVAAVGVAVLLRGQSSFDRTARAVATLPLPVPHLVAGALGVLVLAQSGLAARALVAIGMLDAIEAAPALVQDRFGVGAILVLAWKEFPFLALLASAALAQRGTALEEMARTLGATPWQTFRTVTWPLLRRSLAPAVIAVFAFAAGCYEIAALLGPSDPLPFPVLLHERQTAAALAARADTDVLSLLALVGSLLVVALHEWTRARVEAA